MRVTPNLDEYLELLNCLNEHIHLIDLYIIDNLDNRIDGSQLKQLTANQKDLVNLTLEYKEEGESNVDGFYKVDANAGISFLESHNKMKQLNFINFSEPWIADLQKQWCSRVIDNGIVFFKGN